MTDIDPCDGTTPIDPDEARGLLLTHVTTQGELNRWEQDNIAEALAWLRKTRPREIVNEAFIQTLHHRMFGNVWEWAGQFRQSDKNMGSPWYQIQMDIKSFCDDASLWLQLREESPDEIAVRFHHRLVSIHPFANGNGRHARLMADLLLENVLDSPPFSWGSADLSRIGGVRRAYITALQAADRGDYEPLVMFARS